MIMDELATEEEFCTWSEQKDGVHWRWEFGCGGSFSFNSDVLVSNNMKYCPFCGKSFKHCPYCGKLIEEIT